MLILFESLSRQNAKFKYNKFTKERPIHGLLYTCNYFTLFLYFLSYFIPSLILFPTFHRPDRDNRHLKVAGIISAVFILFVFMLPKTISNSVCSFGIYFFWYANFSFLLEGRKSFKLTLALCFYCLPLFIEILCGVVVTFITLFFPSSNIVNAYSLIANNYFSIFLWLCLVFFGNWYPLNR